jgi:hypothetical protein
MTDMGDATNGTVRGDECIIANLDATISKNMGECIDANIFMSRLVSGQRILNTLVMRDF